MADHKFWPERVLREWSEGESPSASHRRQGRETRVTLGLNTTFRERSQPTLHMPIFEYNTAASQLSPSRSIAPAVQLRPFAVPPPSRPFASPPCELGCQRYKGGVKRCLPKLIIIGMFKCGTTAMFDTIAQHPDVLLPRKLENGEWHEKCPLGKPSCVIKEVNGFVRLGEKMRWSERALLQRYGMGLMPNQTEDDERPVMEASPYYFAGMVDAADDLERIVRYIPDVKCASPPLARGHT